MFRTLGFALEPHTLHLLPVKHKGLGGQGRLSPLFLFKLHVAVASTLIPLVPGNFARENRPVEGKRPLQVRLSHIRVQMFDKDIVVRGQFVNGFFPSDPDRFGEENGMVGLVFGVLGILLVVVRHEGEATRLF